MENEFKGYCDKCKRHGAKATKDNPKGIVYQWPEERWLCDACLTTEIRKIIYSGQIN